MATSNRCRGRMRGGLLSSFSVPGAGMWMSVEPNCEAGQKPVVLIGVVGVAWTAPQKSPAWNCWSGVSPEISTGLTPSPNGADPATSPLSYLQLKPTHGPRCHG